MAEFLNKCRINNANYKTKCPKCKSSRADLLCWLYRATCTEACSPNDDARISSIKAACMFSWKCSYFYNTRPQSTATLSTTYGWRLAPSLSTLLSFLISSFSCAAGPFLQFSKAKSIHSLSWRAQGSDRNAYVFPLTAINCSHRLEQYWLDMKRSQFSINFPSFRRDTVSPLVTMTPMVQCTTMQAGLWKLTETVSRSNRCCCVSNGLWLRTPILSLSVNVRGERTTPLRLCV